METGAGVAGANSYHDLVSAAAYFAEHPNAGAWTNSTDPLRTEALLYTCPWLEDRYAEGLASYVVSTEQSRIWPRWQFYDRRGRRVPTGTVPDDWKAAHAEAALAHLTSPINEVRDRGGAIESISAGSVEVVWSSGASSGRTFPYIDALVAPFLEFGGQRRLVRG